MGPPYEFRIGTLNIRAISDIIAGLPNRRAPEFVTPVKLGQKNGVKSVARCPTCGRACRHRVRTRQTVQRNAGIRMGFSHNGHSGKRIIFNESTGAHVVETGIKSSTNAEATSIRKPIASPMPQDLAQAGASSDLLNISTSTIASEEANDSYTTVNLSAAAENSNGKFDAGATSVRQPNASPSPQDPGRNISGRAEHIVIINDCNRRLHLYNRRFIGRR